MALTLLDPATEADVECAKRCAERALRDPRATFDSSDMIRVFKYVQLLNWKIDKMKEQRAAIVEVMEKAVCTVGEDKGVVLLDLNGTTHLEQVDGRTVQVYDHEYFSPLGDALIEVWMLASKPV